MIFITTGTVSYPFSRLVDGAIQMFSDSDQKVLIQAGNYRPKNKSKNIKIVDFLPFDQTLKLYKTANLIISACGEASIYLLLQNSKNTPIFFPRLKKYGEHVDDQQSMNAKYLEKNNLADVCYDIEVLKKLINKPRKKQFRKILKNKGNENIISFLKKIT